MVQTIILNNINNLISCRLIYKNNNVIDFKFILKTLRIFN